MKGEIVTIYWRIQRTKYFNFPQFDFELQHKTFVLLPAKNEAAKMLVYMGIMTILFVCGFM